MSNDTGPNTTSIESRARYACMNGANVSSITGKVVKLAREADAEIERLRADTDALRRELQDFEADTASEDRCAALESENATLRARVAELERALLLIEPSGDFSGWEDKHGRDIGNSINAALAKDGA